MSKNVDSPYWNWLKKLSITEPIEANPDLVSSKKNLWNSDDPHLDDKKELAHFFLSKLKRLSMREFQVMTLAIDGKSEREIATVLSITQGSIKDYKKRARTKLIKFATQSHKNADTVQTYLQKREEK